MCITKIGEAMAHGAVTIINAMATGRGAALGIDLWTKARVKLTNDPSLIEGKIISDPQEDTTLIKNTVKAVLKYFDLEKTYGAFAETDSNIPIARGLKSSSVAANALVLATAAALEGEIPDLTAVKLGVDAALKSNVTLTGAFDDACASFFGNAVVTNNLTKKIEKTFEVEGDYSILLQVPEAKSYSASVDVERVRLIAPQVELAHAEARKGMLWTALTLNGLLFSAVLGYDVKLVFAALSRGALAAGLSGKGPATVVVTPRACREEVMDAVRKFGGSMIEARINREKAHALRG